MYKNPKTKTDLYFENYLKQQGFNYVYEPFGSKKGTTNPDYLIKKKMKVLVECKEIEFSVFDKVKGAGSIDIEEHWSHLRSKIYEASKQLKPFATNVDHCLIILGKHKGFAQLSINDLHYAMFGNPVIRIPLGTRIGVPAAKAKFDLKVMGALRKNHPQTRQMYFPHNYISGIGIINEFSGYDYYKQVFSDRIFNKFYDKKKPIEDQMDIFDKIDESWELHKIPKAYRDQKKKFYKLLFIINPLSFNPLPVGFFKGKWDEVRSPQAVAY